MKRENDRGRDTDKTMAAVCGLYCEGCTWYIAATEDPERLKRLAARLHFSEEEGRCYGCRSDKRTPYCEKCGMFACAAERGIDFCSQCEEYPCVDLKRFQSAMPHRIELYDNLARIKSVGHAKWLEEMRERFACPRCRTVNSAYDLRCRRCGGEPSCGYVAEHRREIERYLADR